MKVRKSTSNYLHEAAMTEEEMEMCWRRGAEVVRQCHEEGSNVLSFGEMGIGNTFFILPVDDLLYRYSWNNVSAQAADSTARASATNTKC